MSKALDALLETLEQTCFMYETLLQLVQKERDLVLKSNVASLNAVLAEKQNVLAQLRSIDKVRVKQLKQIAITMHIPLQQLNLSLLAERVPALYAERIRTRRIELRQILAAIRKVNEECRSLIKHCLDIVQGGLQFLQHWMTPPAVYGATGNIDGASKSGSLLSGTV